jgi:hypothetical protein
MRRGAHIPPQGQVRQSQVITTFGPGAFLDLPEYSVLVGGLEGWSEGGEEVHEPRLVEKLKRLFNPPLPALKLRTPPPLSDDLLGVRRIGVTGWQFPEWFVTQNVVATEAGGKVRSRYLIHRKRLTSGKFIDEDRGKHPVVPVRFVRACPKGHIGDIDWYYFVHQGKRKCFQQLYVDETGTSGDIYDILIRCQCGMSRPMGDATNRKIPALGTCDGARPWLGPFLPPEACGAPNWLLIRTASNAYFPRVMSVISLPDRQDSLEKAVNAAWPFVQGAGSAEHIGVFRTIEAVKAALAGFTAAEVYKEILARKGFSGEASSKSVKQVEIEVLSVCEERIGADTPDGTFDGRAWPRKHWDRPWTEALDKVVLVHRLREVMAQVGFTRFEASSPGVDGELEIGAQMAPVARDVTWLPAVENRGEGIFLGFKKERIEAWFKQKAVQDRARQLSAGFDCWFEEHRKSGRTFPGPRYILLHSLSHLLITSLALECGYPSSSIRERVYAGDSGYGILLYTGTSDAEGTMGGLVEAGKHIDRHLKAALEMGGLCSNDPVCAQHDPCSPHEHRFLHGAACHGCLLIAETSCEQFNDYLDRALVVATVDNLGAEFFKQ